MNRDIRPLASGDSMRLQPLRPAAFYIQYRQAPGRGSNERAIQPQLSSPSPRRGPPRPTESPTPSATPPGPSKAVQATISQLREPSPLHLSSYRLQAPPGIQAQPGPASRNHTASQISVSSPHSVQPCHAKLRRVTPRAERSRRSLVGLALHVRKASPAHHITGRPSNPRGTYRSSRPPQAVQPAVSARYGP
ncbi:hypothetical protein NDU88_005593 [Pleurodeles waltl]|uniref:Uncharacterized protein n=1 Tax=Pleurodeles waltl TaxID=8319 RepID=A0AAV7LN77_PLEWA|nr:hypothetical protein NDU88_005593 [Pleurodeles waltl]